MFTKIFASPIKIFISLYCVGHLLTTISVECHLLNLQVVKCSMSSTKVTKRDFFTANSIYLIDVKESCLATNIPNIKFVARMSHRTCFFDCVMYCVLANKRLCRYFQEWEFDSKHFLSDAMSVFVNICLSCDQSKYKIDAIYSSCLKNINIACPNANFEINRQECFMDFLVAFFDTLIAENKALYANKEGKNLFDDIFPTKGNVRKSGLLCMEERTATSHIHALILKKTDSELEIDQILERIVENTSFDQLYNASHYQFDSQCMHIFINRFELASEIAREQTKRKFRVKIRTYFAMCIPIKKDYFVFKLAIIFKPKNATGGEGHYFCLYYDYAFETFFKISNKTKKRISYKKGLDYLYEQSLMVLYENTSE